MSVFFIAVSNRPFANTVDEVCKPASVWTQFRNDFNSTFPDGYKGKERELNSDERISFLSWFNSYPPITDYNPERVVLFYGGGHMQFGITFITDDCVTYSTVVPIHVLPQVLNSLRGI